MDQSPVNPLFISLLFIARCLVPLVVMLIVSYIFRRLGLIEKPTPPPVENGIHEEGNYRTHEA